MYPSYSCNFLEREYLPVFTFLFFPSLFIF
jgi:hypothetical protein